MFETLDYYHDLKKDKQELQCVNLRNQDDVFVPT